MNPTESTHPSPRTILIVGVIVGAVVIWVHPQIRSAMQKDTRMNPANTDRQWQRDARSAIKITFRTGWPVKDWTYGRLAGGVAVLVNDDAAYWIDADGAVYAGNGIAKQMSPSIPYARTGIDIITITAAVADRPAGQ